MAELPRLDRLIGPADMAADDRHWILDCDAGHGRVH
jgi:hypothetical protein